MALPANPYLPGSYGPDVTDGIDYARLKRVYEADDYVSMAFTATEDYYIVGLMAYVSDTTVADLFAGWGLYRHNQAASPIFLVALLGPTLTAEVPSFEAKDILFLSTQDCYVRFDGVSRVQHRIPANTYMHFHRRCNMIFVVGAIAGTLEAWFEG